MAQSTSPASRLTAGSAPSLRQRNSQAVLETLYHYGQSSSAPAPSLRVVEIMEMTGLSRPTVETVAEGLTEQGWLVLGEPAEGGGRLGRPAKTFTFCARAGHVVGVDVGSHSVAVSVADLWGGQVALTRRTVSPSTPAEERFATLRTALAGSLRKAGLSTSDLLALTAGTPGILDPARQRVLTSPGLAGWADFDLLAALEALVRCPVELENDANLAAVAERHAEPETPDDLLFLLLGERLGAGVIANGRLLRGHNGASGELWYVQSGVADARTGRGRPLGEIVNAPALSQVTRAATPRPRRASSARGARPASDVSPENPVLHIAHELARGIAPVVLALNPEVVVLGGDVIAAGDGLKEALAAALEVAVLFPPRLELSRLGVDAILAGAVLQGRSRVEREVLARVSA